MSRFSDTPLGFANGIAQSYLDSSVLFRQDILFGHSECMFVLEMENPGQVRFVIVIRWNIRGW